MHKNILLACLAIMTASLSRATERTYINLRDTPLTLTITLSNDPVKRTLEVPGEGSATFDTGGATIESITVSGKRMGINRSFTFDEGFKKKYKQVLNSPEMMNFLDNDNVHPGRAFRLMETDTPKGREELKERFNNFSDSVKEAVSDGAVKAGQAASWISDFLRSIRHTAADIRVYTR